MNYLQWLAWLLILLSGGHITQNGWNRNAILTAASNIFGSKRILTKIAKITTGQSAIF